MGRLREEIIRDYLAEQCVAEAGYDLGEMARGLDAALTPSDEALREAFIEGHDLGLQHSSKIELDNWTVPEAVATAIVEAARRYPRQPAPEPKSSYICINDHHRNDFLLVDGYKMCAEPGCRADTEPVEPAPEPKETK